jgi:hypothetical protein
MLECRRVAIKKRAALWDLFQDFANFRHFVTGVFSISDSHTVSSRFLGKVAYFRFRPLRIQLL